MAGFSGTFSAPLYCATKHAVVGFVRSMAALEDYGGVKVVAVAPGCVFISNVIGSGTFQLMADIASFKPLYGRIIQRRWNNLAIRSKTQ